MDKVMQFIKEMKLKRKLIGGVDEEDVLIHVKNLCEIFGEELKTRPSLEDVEAFKQQIQQLQGENELLKAKVAQQQTESAQTYQHKLEELNGMLEVVQDVKKEATVRAQVEAIREAAALRSEIMEKTDRERMKAEQELSQLRTSLEALEQKRSSTERAMQENAGRVKEILYQMIHELDRSLESHVLVQMRTDGDASEANIQQISGAGSQTLTLLP